MVGIEEPPYEVCFLCGQASHLATLPSTADSVLSKLDKQDTKKVTVELCQGTLALTQCQASADLYDLFMSSKPVPPERLRHYQILLPAQGKQEIKSSPSALQSALLKAVGSPAEQGSPSSHILPESLAAQGADWCSQNKAAFLIEEPGGSGHPRNRYLQS
ncbi:hypothetical protein STEG23_021278 [Scotinomys teguina]